MANEMCYANSYDVYTSRRRYDMNTMDYNHKTMNLGALSDRELLERLEKLRNVCNVYKGCRDGSMQAAFSFGNGHALEAELAQRKVEFKPIELGR